MLPINLRLQRFMHWKKPTALQERPDPPPCTQVSVLQNCTPSSTDTNNTTNMPRKHDESDNLNINGKNAHAPNTLRSGEQLGNRLRGTTSRRTYKTERTSNPPKTTLYFRQRKHWVNILFTAAFFPNPH